MKYGQRGLVCIDKKIADIRIEENNSISGKYQVELMSYDMSVIFKTHKNYFDKFEIGKKYMVIIDEQESSDN